MKGSPAEVLREAVRDQHSNETFEKALGRTARNHQGGFEDYKDLIARVRLRARKDGASLAEAARALAGEGK